MRDFRVCDEGDEFQLQLFDNQEQIGCALFPDPDGTGAGLHTAMELGGLWVRAGNARQIEETKIGVRGAPV